MVLSNSSGPVFLGSPVWGPPGVFAAFVDSVIERVSVLQGRLRDLDNPQVELHLLCSCLGVCKLNHLLHMVSPDSILPQLRLFDGNLCHSLSCICNSSISGQAWHQAIYLFPLVAWVCARLLMFCQLLFLGAVLALRNCVINYWLHSMILLFLFPPFLEENQLLLACHLCYLGVTLHQSTTHPKLRVFCTIL